MKKLYTDEELFQCKSRDYLPYECEYCTKTFYKQKKRINTGHINLDYCCKLCKSLGEGTKQKVICAECGKYFIKKSSEIRKGHQNNFCSRSCSITYNNTHKTTGTRRSKLEIYIEKQLIITYPGLEFHFNKKDSIGSELDIYIPSLRLAFELNGIFHYEPIYGDEKLNKIQINDKNKIIECYNKGIDLYIIDTSSQKYFKEMTSQKFLDIIIGIVNRKK